MHHGCKVALNARRHCWRQIGVGENKPVSGVFPFRPFLRNPAWDPARGYRGRAVHLGAGRPAANALGPRPRPRLEEGVDVGTRIPGFVKINNGQNRIEVRSRATRRPRAGVHEAGGHQRVDALHSQEKSARAAGRLRSSSKARRTPCRRSYMSWSRSGQELPPAPGAGIARSDPAAAVTGGIVQPTANKPRLAVMHREQPEANFAPEPHALSALPAGRVPQHRSVWTQ